MINLGEVVVMFDVDETLVSFKPEHESAPEFIPLLNHKIQPAVHQYHKLKLMEHKARGHTVIVWSAGGAAWAEQVVKMMGIEEYVDAVMAKPSWYYDDRAADAILGERIYLDFETGKHIVGEF